MIGPLPVQIDCYDGISSFGICKPGLGLIESAARYRSARDTSTRNTVRMDRFSSDRSVREHCERVWKVGPTPAEVPRQ